MHEDVVEVEAAHIAQMLKKLSNVCLLNFQRMINMRDER